MVTFQRKMYVEQNKKLKTKFGKCLSGISQYSIYTLEY